ncbi:hypothetical protein HDU79_010803 [Rhizoclosmatium sp. JEL0117]|nr:hypothetical protein HDU79_010803 [Rhizoclosmatium sp. JEL0117]
MQQDPTLVWQLVLPAINYISDIARLSQSCRALYAISITAAYETHKLHSTTSIPFLKLCRYTVFNNEFLSNPTRRGGHMMSVMVRLPSNVPELSGGIFFLDCLTKGGYSTHVTCHIPRSKTAGTPTDDVAFRDDVPMDPCQEALRNLFRNCTISEYKLKEPSFVVSVFNTNPGTVQPQFASIFETLISKYDENCRISTTELLSILFKGIDFQRRTVGIPHRLWFPLFYPSVSLLYEHPLSKSALLNRFDFVEKLVRRIKRQMKIPIFIALYDSTFSWFPDISDSGSEMSEDYEYLTDDEEENLLEEVSDFVPEGIDIVAVVNDYLSGSTASEPFKLAFSKLRDAIPESTWDPTRSVNLGVDDEYLLHRDQIAVDEMADDMLDVTECNDVMTDITMVPSQPPFQLTMELALSMFQNMSFKESKPDNVDLIFTPPSDLNNRQWHFNLALDNSSKLRRLKINVINYSAQCIKSRDYSTETILFEFLQAFGRSVHASNVEQNQITPQVKQFLIICAQTVRYTEHTDFLYATDKCGALFEKLVGYRELIRPDSTGTDGFECFGAFSNTYQNGVFDRMQDSMKGRFFSDTSSSTTTSSPPPPPPPLSAPSITLSSNAQAVHQSVQQSLELNRLRVKSQHLSRLLADSQQTTKAQATEIAVLKRALVEYSELSLRSDEKDVSLIEAALHKDPLVAALAQELQDARAKITTLSNDIALKQTTIDSLTHSLESTQRTLVFTKEDLAETRKKLEEAEESLRQQHTSLVDAMLLRATTEKSPSKQRQQEQHQCSQKKPKEPSDYRGRTKTRKDPPQRDPASFSKPTVAWKNHLAPPPPPLSSSSKPSTVLAKNQSTNQQGRTATLTQPHTFSTHPTCTKHARSHSYDSYLKQLMQQKLEYSNLHPQNVNGIRNQARALNRSCERESDIVAESSSQIENQSGIGRQRSPKSFKSESKEFKVVTLEEPSLSTNGFLCTNLDDMQWLHYPSKQSSSTTNTLKNATTSTYTPTIKSAVPTSFSSKKQRDLETSNKDRTLDILNARALQAEMERDALEEELLAILKTVNKGGKVDMSTVMIGGKPVG